MAKGIYRTKDGWGAEDSVRVMHDGGQEMDVSASYYEQRGYDPPIENLPWRSQSGDGNA